MPMPALALEAMGLTAGYGPTRIIEDVSFSVPAGGRMAVLGRNGMGKTTLLATLAGQTRRWAGAIRLGETELTGLEGPARALAGLGYVPQHRAIFAGLTVEENLVAGLKDRPRAALAEAYGLFPRLRERRHAGGGRLSGGEQQMLAVARSLLGRPGVLLLDEPLEGLAPVIAGELMDALARLAAERRTTILLVEQRLEAALAFAETVLILERGRVAWTGAPEALRAAPAVVERLLGVGKREAGLRGSTASP
jgi:branched-chain amino acid transport system ATP-binding protein